MRLLKTCVCLSVLLQTTIAYSQDGYINGTPSLAYWTVGNSEEIIIVLHGGPGAAHDYLRPEWDRLSKMAKVVYYDQRGCGKSQKSKCYTWREHLQDLKRVIRTFSKGKKVILAGSSWGTSLALLYAYALPEDIKAIILSGTFQWWGNGNVDRSCYYYTQRTLPKKDTFHYRSLKYGFEIPSSSVANKSLMEKIIKEQKIIEIHTVSRAIALKSLHDAPGLNDLKKIKVPILIFKGTGVCDAENQILQQIKDGANQFTGVLPKLEVYTITEACHDPWFTHTEEFFAKSIEFLERVK